MWPATPWCTNVRNSLRRLGGSTICLYLSRPPTASMTRQSTPLSMSNELNCCQYALAVGLLALAVAQFSLSPARIHSSTYPISLSFCCSSARKAGVQGSSRPSTCSLVRPFCDLLLRPALLSHPMSCATDGVPSGPMSVAVIVSSVSGCALFRCARVVTAHTCAWCGSSKKNSSRAGGTPSSGFHRSPCSQSVAYNGSSHTTLPASLLLSGSGCPSSKA